MLIFKSISYINYYEKLPSNFYEIIETVHKNMRKQYLNTGLSSELLTPILSEQFFKEFSKRQKSNMEDYKKELNVY